MRLLFEKFTSFVEEYASCLSLGGMFVRTADVRDIGESVGFEIALSDGFQLARGVGEVVWRRPADGGVGRPAGMAIRFTALDQQGRDLILKILEEQVRGGGEPFEVDAPPPDAETAPAGERPSLSDDLEDTEDPTLISKKRAPAFEEGSPGRTTDTGPESEPRHGLEFDAPWGNALPELPSEVFDDPAGSSADGRSTDVMAAQTDSFSAQVDAATAKSPVSPGASTRPPSPLPAGGLADRAPDMAGAAGGDRPPGDSLFAATVAHGRPAVPAELPASPPAPSVGGWAMTSGAAAVSTTPGPDRPTSELLRNDLASISLGPVLDYEHELDGVAADRRSGRLSSASGARRRLALLTLVLVLVTGGYLGKDRLAAYLGSERSPASEVDAGLSGGDDPGQPLPAASEDPIASAEPTAGSPTPVEAPEPPAGGPGSSAEGVVQGSPSVSGRPASAILGISWAVSRRGTSVTIRLDGELERGRVRHGRLPWTPLKEQITLTGIPNPYHPATIEVGSAELDRIRTGMHVASPAPELRLVFDFHASGMGLDVVRVSAGRLEVLIHRVSP